MATNTGSNGGKNNTGSGVMRGTANVDQSQGLGAAFNQASYRKEYNDKMFSDNGFLQSSIKDLQKQAEELERLLKNSEKLTKTEQNRYNKMANSMRELAAEQDEMYKKQEASSKELQSSLTKSANMRLKSVDELYQAYMKKEKELNNVGKRQVDAKIREFASKSREIKADVEDINSATDAFNKAQKSFKEGLSESVNNFTKAATSITNLINLQSIANNEYTKKANERYETMNKINATLGFQINEGKGVYSSIVSEFKDFNNNIGNLFSMDDLKDYLQQADSNGIHDQQLLQETLNQSMIATKYLGMSSETQNSLYKYMRLTNNNDTISSYNKLMVTLQKEHIGVSRDMLDNMIQQNTEVSDVLAAAGLSGEALEQFTNNRNILNAQISSKYGDEYGEQVNEMVNTAIKNLATDSGKQQLAQQGVNPWQLSSALSRGDASEIYDLVITGMSKMGGKNLGNTMANMTYQNYLGLNSGDINAATKIGANGIDELGEATQDILDKVEQMKDEEAESYVKENTAISDLTRLSNKNNVWLEDTFGDSWFSYENMAKLFFGAAIVGNAFQIIGGIGKGIGGLVKFFGAGGGVKGFAAMLGVTEAGTTGAGGLAGLLGTAGPIALGIGATIGAIAGINGIVNSIYQNSIKVTQDKKDYYSNKLSESNSPMADDDTYVTAYTQGAGAASNNNWNGYWGTFANVTTAWLNNFNKKDPEKFNLELWRNFDRTASGTNWYTAQKGTDLRYMYSILLNEAGTPSVAESEFGISKDDIKNYIKNDSKAESRIKDAYDTWSSKAGWANYGNVWPIDYDGKKHSDLNIDGYHKAGLNYVPKENYRALLHQGEMVLNKADADAYRALLSRQSTPESTKKYIKKSKLDELGDYQGGESDSIYKSQRGKILSDLKWTMTAGWPSYPSGGQHRGLDFGIPIGTEVGAAYPGTVSAVDTSVKSNTYKAGIRSYGTYVRIKGDNGKYFRYGHLSAVNVTPGQRVSAGDLIGKSGNTGYSTGPHLHYQVDSNESSSSDINPYGYINSSLWEIGNRSGNTISTSSTTGSSSSSLTTELAKVNTTGHRAIPGMGGIDSDPNAPKTTERIITSIDGVSSKIIKYLDEIRQEQADQRQLINAFSASQQSISDYR